MAQTREAGSEAQRGGRGYPLFRIVGIQIRIDRSWILIFVLILWSLSVGYFPRMHPDESTLAYAGAGLVATLLFFASILIHELSHSLVAMRAGIRIEAITLFLFGGVSQMQGEPEDPKTEIRVAAVGPLTSFALAGTFAAAYWGLGGFQGDTGLWIGVVGYLAWINLALGIFNMVPGFPLDGGRVLRAVAWWRTGSLVRATRLASDVGKGFAVALMILGAVQIFAGALIGGLWLILIGLFLRAMAGAGYQQTVLKQWLEGIAVGDVMTRELVTVSSDTPVASLIDDFVLGHGFRGFPVVDGGRVRGVVSIPDVKDVPPDKRGEVRVADRMRSLDDAVRIGPEASLSDALQHMGEHDAGRLLVMQGDRLLGMLTRTGLARQIELRQALDAELPEGAGGS